MTIENLVDPLALPEAVQLKLAYGLVGKESTLERRILYNLLGQPKRYSELKPLIGEKRDHNLTVALQRLQVTGLIDRRTNARQKPIIHAYQITPLGIQVVLAMQSIQPIHAHLKSFEKARSSATVT